MSKDLEEVAEFYGEDTGFKKDWGVLHSRLVKERYKSLSEWFGRGKYLEMGIADGEFTQYLLEDENVEELVGIEGSQKFIDQCNHRFCNYKNFRFVHTMFESFDPDEYYDTILAMHILEHVDDPVGLLQRVKGWMHPNHGMAIINVPNAFSLHRMVGYKMDMIPHPGALHSLDRDLGHQRVYNINTLRQDVEAAGLRMLNEGGIFLKPLSNSQIQKDWSPELIDAFFDLGKLGIFAPFAAEIWMVCAT